MDWTQNPFARAQAFLELVGIGNEFQALLDCGWSCFAGNVSRLLSEPEVSTVFEPLLEEEGELHRVLTASGSSEAPASPRRVTAQMFDVFDLLSVEMMARLREAFGLALGTASEPLPTALAAGNAHHEEEFNLPAANDDSDPRSNEAADAQKKHADDVRHVSLQEQYVVDAIDCWISRRTEAQNKRLVLACGVEPAALEAAASKAAQRSSVQAALADFVIDVILPREREIYGTGLDWLFVAVEKNAALDVDDDEAVAALPTPSPQKRHRCDDDNGDVLLVEGSGGGGEVDADGDLIVTQRNVDQLMLSKPELLPRYVIIQKRKALDDDDITAFEAEHHYTVTELRSFIKLKDLDLSPFKGTSKKSGLAVAVLSALKRKKDQ